MPLGSECSVNDMQQKNSHLDTILNVCLTAGHGIIGCILYLCDLHLASGEYVSMYMVKYVHVLVGHCR